MALTQLQIIQSLGEAMSWFERELAWGVPPTELRHLTGRIGELYAALITNGQMATNVNEKGYDVVGETGERVSVKTTAMMNQNGHISFNPNTLDMVDRVIIFRINTEEMQIETLLNEPTESAKQIMTPANSAGKRNITLSKLLGGRPAVREVNTVSSVEHGQYTVRALENGAIEVLMGSKSVLPVKPVLREIAAQIGVPRINANGNPHNTRQLGSLVIKAIEDG